MRIEDYLFEEWNRARQLCVASKGRKGSAYYALADKIQQLLEDCGPYGRSLVYRG